MMIDLLLAPANNATAQWLYCTTHCCWALHYVHTIVGHQLLERNALMCHLAECSSVVWKAIALFPLFVVLHDQFATMYVPTD
jgi:hypothetical protein